MKRGEPEDPQRPLTKRKAKGSKTEDARRWRSPSIRLCFGLPVSCSPAFLASSAVAAIQPRDVTRTRRKMTRSACSKGNVESWGGQQFIYSTLREAGETGYRDCCRSPLTPKQQEARPHIPPIAAVPRPHLGPHILTLLVHPLQSVSRCHLCLHRPVLAASGGLGRSILLPNRCREVRDPGQPSPSACGGQNSDASAPETPFFGKDSTRYR